MSDPLKVIAQENAPAFYRRAHGPRTCEALEMGFLLVEAQIQKLIEQDPEETARSDLGRLHLQRYPFLLPRQKLAEIAIYWGWENVEFKGEPYPRQFELKDVLLEAVEITAQLIAEEYFEDAGELTPYTLEALEQFVFGRTERPDPFSTDYRPNCTVEAVHPDGRREVVNLNPDKPITEKPERGFRELNNG